MASSLPFETPAGAPADQGQFDFRYYLQVLWRGRFLIAASAAVSLCLALFAAFLQTPEYRASALIQIEPPTPVFMNVQEAASSVAGYWNNADFYNTQFKILRSSAVGDRVVQKLGLADQPPFKGTPSASALLMSKVAIEPVPDSRLVAVAVTHENAQQAAQWANAITEAYVDVSVQSRVDAAKRVYDWLQERLDRTQGGWREAQEKLIRGLDPQSAVAGEGGVSAVARSIEKLNDDYMEVSGRRLALDAALKQIAAMQARSEALDAIPQVAADEAVTTYNNQLVALTLEKGRLLQAYKEGHPSVQKLLAQIEQTTRAKEGRITAVVEALRAEFHQLQRREAELLAAIGQQRNQAAENSRKITEYEIVRREADTAKGIYDMLLQKMNESEIASSLRSGNQVTVVERAVAPRSAVRPDKRKMAMTGLVVGLLLGVGLVLLRDYLDDTLTDPEEVERYLHVDLLAAVPRYDETTAHFVTEAYQSLRTALLFARSGEQGQVVLVTGTLPQEGKTTTLVNMGKLLASAGERALVVDMDLRRATLHTNVGLTREPGVTDYFANRMLLDRLVRPTRVPNLYAMTAGALPPNPPALLARQELPDLLAELRLHFHWILLDSPPLASVTDALLLARHADMTLMIVRHNRADKRLVKKMVGSLRKTTPNLLGVVFNAVDVNAKGYYYHYQYSYYGTEERGPDAARPQANPKGPSAPEV